MALTFVDGMVSAIIISHHFRLVLDLIQAKEVRYEKIYNLDEGLIIETYQFEFHVSLFFVATLVEPSLHTNWYSFSLLTIEKGP